MIRRRCGFTLIEILIVVAIIAVLVVILLPVLSRARERARQSTCSSNMRQLTMGLLMAVSENQDEFPGKPGVADGNAWLTEVTPQLKSNDVWRCPSNTQEKSELDYGLNFNLYGLPMGSMQETTTQIMVLCDASGGTGLIESAGDVASKRHNGGFIASFLDGHQEYLSADGPKIIFDDGGQGSYLCFGVVHLPVIFKADNAASGKSTSLIEGEAVLLVNDTKVALTPKITVQGGTTPPAKGLIPGTSEVTIAPGQSRAFSLQCRTDSSGNKADTTYTFGEAPSAVSVVVQEYVEPQSNFLMLE